MGLLIQRRVRTELWILLGTLALCGGAIVIDLARIYSQASALVSSATGIHTKADAEREIAAWKSREGKGFWTESDHLAGDHNYDAVVENLWLARLHIVEPTGITVGITMRNGELRSVVVIESTGWYPVASVWVQEWFGEDMPRRIHVSGSRGYAAALEFPSTLTEELKRKAFAVNRKCLVRPQGCKSPAEILPGIWQLDSAVSPN